MQLFSNIKRFSQTRFSMILIGALVFFLSSCGFKSATYSDADKWIPNDFNPNKSVLLVKTHPASNKENSRMLEWMQKNYPYPYEVVDTSSIKSTTGRYADRKKYQFAVNWNIRNKTTTSMGSNGMVSSGLESHMYGNFVDRSNGRVYPTTGKSNSYGYWRYKPFFQSITKKYK